MDRPQLDIGYAAGNVIHRPRFTAQPLMRILSEACRAEFIGCRCMKRNRANKEKERYHS